MKKKVLLSTLLSASLLSANSTPSDYYIVDANWTLSISPLFWQSHEEGLEYAIENQTGLAFISNNGSVKRIDVDWDFGVRVGLDYDTGCVGTFGAEWTYFCNEGKDSSSATFPAGLFTVWTTPGSAITPSTSAKAKWEMQLNNLDLKIGSCFTPTCYLNLEPYFSLTNLWIDQKFSIDSSGGTSQGGAAMVVLDDKVRLKNDFWGIGPKVGLNSSWNLGCGFSFFANSNFAILYGKFDVTQQEEILFEDLTPAIVYLDLNKDKYWIARTALDILFGIRWEYSFCDCCYFIDFELGWENLYFFGQNQLKRFTDDTNPGIHTTIDGDLGIQGMTLKVAFSF